ncbi:Uncharacterised protein [Serratia plymuthica]|nr:Uncharacterised protein [Serratia plymuthica]
MKFKSLFLFLLFIQCTSAMAIMWPTVVDTRITGCSTGESGPCSDSVSYSATVRMVERGNPSIAYPVSYQAYIVAWGVHCATGSALMGKPFANCTWQKDGHAPLVTGRCDTKGGSFSPDAWTLTTDSTCTTQSTYGNHTGAGPGGECVLLGISQVGSAIVTTPWGTIDATTAANSGNTDCVKPLPPGVTCEMFLPSVIDHGAISAGVNDVKYINGVVDCGTTPKVAVVGNPDLTLGSGVTTKLSASMISKDTLRVQSDLTTSALASPGTYKASAVISVSPY